MEIRDLFKEYQHVLRGQQFNPDDVDYRVLDYHIPFLERLDSIENSSVALFDLYKACYQFLTNKFKFLAGYEPVEAFEKGPDYFFDLMHPEDLAKVLETSIETFRFLDSVPVAERKDYKLSLDFRIRKADGNYLRMIQQVVILELDNAGNIWLVLIINDVASQNGDAPVRRNLINLKNKKFYLFPIEEWERDTKPALSKREIEVLGLIAKGFVSKQIADKLFISVHTVNNHRQNILEKINVSNSSEAVKYAAKLGLI